MKKALQRPSWSALCALLLCFGLLGACRSAPPDALRGVTPRREAFAHQIAATGKLQPVVQETLSVPRRVYGTLEMIVPEGTQVKKGDPVARINSRQFVERMNRYMEQGVEEQASLMRQRAELPLERLKIQTDVRDKKRAEQIQKLEQELVEAGARLDERVRVRVQQEIAQLKAEAYPLDEKESLYSKGYLAEQELLAARQEVQALETESETAALTLQQQSRAYRAPEIQDAAFKTRAAGLEYRIADLEGQARRALLRTQTRNQSGRVRSFERRFAEVQERMAGTELKAPFDGVVLYLDNVRGQQPHVGMEVWGGMPVVQVVKNEALQVLARVDEFQIPHVQVGQSVQLSVPGLPDKVFAGQVAKIQRLGKFKDETRPSGLKYFDVEISLPETPPVLKANMQVELNIGVATLPQAWTVPLEALHEQADQSLLQLRQPGGSLQPLPVRVLARSTDRAAIEPLNGQLTGREVLSLSAVRTADTVGASPAVSPPAAGSAP